MEGKVGFAGRLKVVGRQIKLPQSVIAHAEQGLRLLVFGIRLKRRFESGCGGGPMFLLIFRESQVELDSGKLGI